MRLFQYSRALLCVTIRRSYYTFEKVHNHTPFEFGYLKFCSSYTNPLKESMADLNGVVYHEKPSAKGYKSVACAEYISDDGPNSIRKLLSPEKLPLGIGCYG